MNNKLMTTMIMLVAILTTPFAFAMDTGSATYIDVKEVEINGDEARNGETLFVERGDELDIQIVVESNATVDVENAQIQAFIAGYRYAEFERDLVTDFTKTFDLPAGNKRSFDLEVTVPQDIDQKNSKLRIIVADENNPNLEVFTYQLNIEGAEESRAVQIQDFLITPNNEVESGRAVSFNVRVRNYGDQDLDDAAVRVSIPELGLTTFESIDRLDEDETQSFEALLLRIPRNVDPGTYDVVAEVEFDRFESTSATTQLTVVGAEEDEQTEDERRTQVTVPDTVQVQAGGAAAVFPILIQNQGSNSQAYTMQANGVTEWGTATFDPSNVVIVEPGRSETVYLKLAANQDATGDQTFRVDISSEGETTTFSAIASIAGGAAQEDGDGTVRTVLEWALVVLVVVLILLGLVLLFSRTGKKGEEAEEEDTEYY